MAPEQILAIAKAMPDIGAVSHKDFTGYIIGIKQGGNENPYMSVDGRVLMASLDHIKQGKRLDYGDPVVLVDNNDYITLQVTITSEVYGKRHGIASSNKKKTTSEGINPWEVAETSAIGRALSQFGYGVFAGSGLPSANDMQRATAPQSKPAATAKPAAPEKKSEPAAAHALGATAPKPAPTNRGGLCETHNEPTHEYKKLDGTLFWFHRHGTEACMNDPKPETVLEVTAMGGVK